MLVSEYLERLDTAARGLSQEEAERRLSQYGYNEIEEKRINPVLKFLSYFWGPIPWMIEAAAVLSVVVQHWVDFGIILVLLLANALVGYWKEHKAFLFFPVRNCIRSEVVVISPMPESVLGISWLDSPAEAP